MGLFDFIKDIGHSPANEDQLENSLREAVNKAQLAIQNFQLKLDKNVAILSGSSSSQKDIELARLIVGNHKGVEKVNDDALKFIPPAAPPTPLASSSSASTASTGVVSGIPYAPAQMVSVKSGDSLSKIAQQYLGDPQRYREIFEANRPMLKDPDEIFPGQVIRIPTEMLSKGRSPGLGAPMS